MPINKHFIALGKAIFENVLYETVSAASKGALTAAVFFLVPYILRSEWLSEGTSFVLHTIGAVPGSFLVKLYACVAALLLFYIRGYFPKTYGWFEVVGGIYAIFYTPDVVPTTVDQAWPLMGGIYIMIRGLDNVCKNLKKDGNYAWKTQFLFNNPPVDKEKGALKAPQKADEETKIAA